MSESPTHEEESDVEPEGRIIPVFCVVDIPVETLNELLIADAENRNESSYRLRYITDYSDEALDAINDEHSKPPVRAFTSPFLGLSVYDLNEIFLKKISDQRHFTRRAFFVLDSATHETGTLLVVEARRLEDITEEDPGIATLRTDFYAARQVAMLSDLAVEDLLEYRDYDRVYYGHEFYLDL